MTVAAVKTKAEKGLGQQFDRLVDDLPGDGWVSALRRDAFSAFEALGIPGRGEEAYKYTDLRRKMSDIFPVADIRSVEATACQIDSALGPLASLDADRFVLVNGFFRADLSKFDGLEGAAEFIALGSLLAKAPAWFEDKFKSERVGAYDGLTALNAAFMNDGVMLKIKEGEAVKRPVLLVHVRVGEAPMASFTRNIVAIEKGATATLVEAFVSVGGAGAGQGNTFADVTVADGGRLEHVVCRMGDGAEQDIAHTIANVGSGAQYNSLHLIAGAGIARHQVSVCMTGEGGLCDVSGVLLGQDEDHIDATLVMDHRVPGCQSRELFKAVLAGGARGVFQGKVIVRANAQRSDGHMMANALMLSEDAEFDSKPELEIYADDVQCGHGSTCADVDQELIFFCRSRGLSEREARALLVSGFVGEVLEKAQDEEVRSGLEAVAGQWLAKQQ